MRKQNTIQVQSTSTTQTAYISATVASMTQVAPNDHLAMIRASLSLLRGNGGRRTPATHLHLYLGQTQARRALSQTRLGNGHRLDVLEAAVA